MDTSSTPDKHNISSYDTSWENWRTEQVQAITQILSQVFKVEEEARQIQTPSRLLKKSSMHSPKTEEEIRQKLTQIREQISEYEHLLKLGLKRVEHALQKMDPAENPLSEKSRTQLIPKQSFFKRLMKKLFA